MEELCIISIDNECHKSYPCQHTCTCRTKDGTFTNILVLATKLVEYPELMNDYLLDHFAYYKPSLKSFAKKDPYPLISVDEIKRLYRENYWKKRDIIYHECLKIIECIDINQRLRSCLEKGYAGFTIFKSEFYGTLTSKQREHIAHELCKKIKDHGLEKIVRSYSNDISIQVYIEIMGLGLHEEGEITMIPEPMNV